MEILPYGLFFWESEQWIFLGRGSHAKDNRGYHLNTWRIRKYIQNITWNPRRAKRKRKEQAPKEARKYGC